MPVNANDPMWGTSGLGPGNLSQAEAIKTILGIGLGGAAFGAGARGISGLGSFLSRNLGGGQKPPLRQSFVRIPVPVKVHNPAERDAMLEAAEQDIEKEGAWLSDMATNAAKTVAGWGGLLRYPGKEPGFLHKMFAGWDEPSAWQKPWAYPSAIGAAGGGVYGGWKLTDYLLDKTRSAEQDSELEEARKDYETALAGRRKIASAESGPLDELAALYEKQAWANETLGGLLALGGLTALGSGIGAYNWTRSTSDDKAIEEAVKRRQAQIAEQAPSPVMAIPTPVPVMSPGRSHWHHLMGYPEEKKKKDLVKESAEKAANIGQAADNFLGRIRSNQMAVWQRLMTPTDGKPAKPEKPAEPAPPQLPSLAGSLGRMAGQATSTAAAR